jgi:methylphosphotriester-DNA--protein-cysteine methyltransferase
LEIQEHPPVEEVQSAEASQEPASSPREKCMYVGSKNSDLYHLPSCAAAKRIKAENLVCFSSPEQAAQQGYKPGCLQ